MPAGDGGRRRGPRPRPDANKELVHVRISPALYDELRQWAEEEDVSLSQLVRSLMLVGRAVADNPALLRQMLKDPSATRTKIVRGVEREGDLRAAGVEGGSGAPAS